MVCCGLLLCARNILVRSKRIDRTRFIRTENIHIIGIEECTCNNFICQLDQLAGYTWDLKFEFSIDISPCLKMFDPCATTKSAVTRGTEIRTLGNLWSSRSFWLHQLDGFSYITVAVNDFPPDIVSRSDLEVFYHLWNVLSHMNSMHKAWYP